MVAKLYKLEVVYRFSSVHMWEKNIEKFDTHWIVFN
jgi:hypothetical protein